VDSEGWATFPDAKTCTVRTNEGEEMIRAEHARQAAALAAAQVAEAAAREASLQAERASTRKKWRRTKARARPSFTTARRSGLRKTKLSASGFSAT
jgi:hypothetical protein